MQNSIASNVPFEELEQFVLGSGERLNAKPIQDCIAQELRELALKVRWDAARFPTASPGELLMRDIVVSPDFGPSLYLVSESPGVVEPPHEHCTWTVVVGIYGSPISSRRAFSSRCYRDVDSP